MVTRSNVEKLIVVKPGVAVPNPGDRLYNDTTKVFNQTVGGIGAYINTSGSGNPTAMDPGAYAGEAFRFIQVRDTSLDKAPTYNRVLEQSGFIHGQCPNGLEITGQAGATAQPSSWLVGAPNAQTSGKIGIASLNEYTLRVSSHGWRTDLMYSQYNTPTIPAKWVSLDWLNTTISTENNRRDYTVKSIVRKFNRMSASNRNMNFAVALAIDTAGTTAGPTLASIIAGGAGTTVTIGYDRGCTAITMLVDDERLAAITALEAQLNTLWSIGGGTAKLAPYRFAEDGCTTTLAGTNDTADLIFIIGIDEQTAYYDEVHQQKRRLNVGFDPGGTLASPSINLTTSPKEDHASGRSLRILMENWEQYRSYTSSKPWGANHVSFANQVIETEQYDVYTVHHCHKRSATSGMPSESPLVTMIACVRFENTASAYYNAGNPNPQKTYVESVLNAVNSHYGLFSGNINL